jgi:hypothetical protein
MMKSESEMEGAVQSTMEKGNGGGFDGRKLWVGRHEADDDILIFDPAEADADAPILSLYSLTQHRMRRFPRAVVLTRIQTIEDEVARGKAKKDYVRRNSRKEAHEQERTEEAARSRDRQRDAILAQHTRYLASIGLTSEGVRETGGDHKVGRRTKCHACGIALDDFARAVCVICGGVLCSCGACACKPK